MHFGDISLEFKKINSPINIKYIWGMLVTYSYFKKLNLKKKKRKKNQSQDGKNG
jgi:hypothetical protein